jgi:hypothetical protein
MRAAVSEVRACSLRRYSGLLHASSPCNACTLEWCELMHLDILAMHPRLQLMHSTHHRLASSRRHPRCCNACMFHCMAAPGIPPRSAQSDGLWRTARGVRMAVRRKREASSAAALPPLHWQVSLRRRAVVPRFTATLRRSVSPSRSEAPSQPSCTLRCRATVHPFAATLQQSPSHEPLGSDIPKGLHSPPPVPVPSAVIPAALPSPQLSLRCLCSLPPARCIPTSSTSKFSRGWICYSAGEFVTVTFSRGE